MNKSDILLVLKELKIDPKKSLGQNFLFDKNTINKIINEAEISENDIILEIGPGLGALTEDLLDKAEMVHVIETEGKFCSFLEKKFEDRDNFSIIHGDVLEVDLPKHNKVVSNIPYSITGPILEKIFFRESPPQGILTIEKKIADRIFFKGDYDDFSRVTVSTNSFMNPIKQTKISPRGFYPKPSIELSLIMLNPKEEIDPFLKNNITRKFYLNFIAGIMPYKNKNIANAIELCCKNNLNLNLAKKEISQILSTLNYENNKLINFKIKDFIEIAKTIYK
jgi:16S rRNA (adenine1518-N6/adenine1519-N6)-dimethyltransferase